MEVILIIIFAILSFFGLVLAWNIFISKNTSTKLGKLTILLIVLIILISIIKRLF